MPQQEVGRTATMAFRLTLVEKNAVEVLASRAACRPSELVRAILRRELQAQGLIGAPASMAVEAGNAEVRHA